MMINTERIKLDETIERHGIDAVITELKSICDEKKDSSRRTLEERAVLANAFGTYDVLTAVANLYDDHGGGAILAALVTKVQADADKLRDGDYKRQCAKQASVLKTNAVREAWGF